MPAAASRLSVLLPAALLLASPVAAAQGSGRARAPQPARQAAPLAAPQAAPMIPVAPTVQGLLGRSEAEVRRILGEPRIARREDGGAMWTYRRPTCALFVFFRRSGREGMRVTGLSSGPLQDGGAAPDVEACLSYGAVL